ncbi:MAG TPA: L-lysine 6-transaminase [Thermoplasmatales archaeon]|nr:L-lysine 6-transaminase [Thermoplasmatales archaeon]HEX17663.1 L-lysine 6-transaminase [Thermoplasmatales archaeon]
MSKIDPKDVHEVLSKYMLVDGFDLVLDLRKSKGCRIYDSRRDRWFIDFFSFFASSPLGCNHPALLEPEFLKKLAEVAVNKPTNSDVYTVEMAEFVDTFARLAKPDHFKYLFFIEGGALAVENALKTAFDWKIRKNLAEGKGEKGEQVIHFQEAFHGRSGYTLSLTNTFDPRKTMYFPKFKWPRIINPKLRFPLTEENLRETIEKEKLAIQQIQDAIDKNPDDIAALIIEPIQGEGGDNHFRGEFLRELRKICDENDIMYILDEVQTGMGLTGKMWAYQHFDFNPDIVCFGKKTQVCGIMVSDRVDEVKDNVFKVSSRINSTFGGNLIDMVRCQKYLEVMKEENLVDNARKQGEVLLKGLREIEEKYPEKVSNSRGRGLMCAFDLPSPEERDRMKKLLYDNGILILPCGPRGIRFRPPLTIGEEEINEGLSIIEKSIKSL